jgi:hypothetical protein
VSFIADKDAKTPLSQDLQAKVTALVEDNGDGVRS